MNLLKINLEKELLKQNKSVVSAKELLFINEYENLASSLADNSLSRIGVAGAAMKGLSIKSNINNNKKETEKFDQSRVFHISQIEKLCNKYYLKFLPSASFNGQVDKYLNFKINNFEAAYGVTCKSEESKNRGWSGNEFYSYKGNTFIAAPKESFKLQERPVDPLLFFQINEEYYYLIHKWGNDLSITRRLKSILSKGWLCNLLVTAILSFLFYYTTNSDNKAVLVIGTALTIVAFMCFGVIVGVIGQSIRFFEKNEYRSNWKD